MSIKAYDVPPYNDDFNTSSLEGKNYLRILFKPGFSVQVRELNQLQSMLQSQIDKFGKSAPYKEIYNHFELNKENIVKRIKEKL